MKRSLALAWLGMALSTSPLARAEGESGTLEIESLVRSAELIFRGRVRSVEHRLSEPDAAQPRPLPFTFVTYEVDEVMKGAVAGAQITLRFIGGPFDSERFLLLPHAPLFDPGDADLLFVKGNVESGCPLVECPGGRLRVISDLVVNELGQRVQIEPDGELTLGPALAFEEIDTHRMSETISLERQEVLAEGETGPPTAEQIRALGELDPERDPTPERLFDFVARTVRRVHTPEELARARAVPTPSADAARPFRIEAFRAVGPPPDAAARFAPSSPAGAATSTTPPPATTEPSVPTISGRGELPRSTTAKAPAAVPAQGHPGALAILAAVLAAIVGVSLLLRSARS